MNQLITEIPLCPDSIQSVEARELFMDLCEHKIARQELTPEILETITGCAFNEQLTELARKQIFKEGMIINGHPNPWLDVVMMSDKRALEYYDKLKLFPCNETEEK